VDEQSDIPPPCDRISHAETDDTPAGHDGISYTVIQTLSYVQGGPKTFPNLFLSELHQTSPNLTKFDDFWHTDGQDDRIM